MIISDIRINGASFRVLGAWTTVITDLLI